jgi:hypothetical protein
LVLVTNVYYVEYAYFATALLFIALGTVGLFCVVYGAWRRNFYGLLFVIAIVIGLATMVYIPDGIPHVTRSMVADSNYMFRLRRFLGAWYQANHTFPKNEAEFNYAMKNGPAVLQDGMELPPAQSPYSQRGDRLSYQLVVVNDTSGPRLDNVSDRPGVIYYCVSSDRQQYWVTMTGLHENTSRGATLKRISDLPDERPFIVTASGNDYPE